MTLKAAGNLVREGPLPGFQDGPLWDLFVTHAPREWGVKEYLQIMERVGPLFEWAVDGIDFAPGVGLTPQEFAVVQAMFDLRGMSVATEWPKRPTGRVVVRCAYHLTWFLDLEDPHWHLGQERAQVQWFQWLHGTPPVGYPEWYPMAMITRVDSRSPMWGDT